MMGGRTNPLTGSKRCTDFVDNHPSIMEPQVFLDHSIAVDHHWGESVEVLAPDAVES